VRLTSKSVTTPFASVPPKAVHGSSTAVGRSLLLREELRSCANAAHLHQNEKRWKQRPRRERVASCWLGRPWWERLINAGLSTNSAAEATGGPAQRALLLTARATVHRLVDAADDLPNAAVDGYFGRGQRLPLHEVGEEHVLRGLR
jgi:hypothetical protein